MGDYFDWWWKGGSWYDLQQREQIEALSLSQSRAAARLRSELRQEAKRSEDLATRLSRLEDAVVAIVELEDLRGVLDTFSDAVATRRYARDVLAQIPALGRVPSSTSPTPPPDVPGYWLHPAVRSVDAALHGDAATQAAASAEARRRDPVRTAQFLAAVAILTRSDVADDDLATLFPTSRRVSTYQRALWLAVAEGGLGEEARRGLAQAIAWVLAQETTQPAQPEGDLVQVRMPGPRVTPDDLDEVVTSHLLGRRTPPADTASATEALADLRALVAAAAAAGRTLPAAGEVPDGVADLLAQVVSAGAPGEEPVVERIIEIRQALAAIGASTSIAAPALLDEDELDVVDLLRADLSADGSPGARAVAVAALQGPIEAVADRLAALAQQPLPDGERVRVAGGISVDITSAGPVDGGWRARLADRVAAMHPTEPYLGSRMIGGGVVAVLALVLGVTSGPGWLLLLVPALGMAGHAAWQWQSSRERRESAVRHALTQAEATIADRTARLAGDLVSLRQRVDRVPADLHEVRTTLPVVV